MLSVCRNLYFIWHSYLQKLSIEVQRNHRELIQLDKSAASSATYRQQNRFPALPVMASTALLGPVSLPNEIVDGRLCSMRNSKMFSHSSNSMARELASLRYMCLGQSMMRSESCKWCERLDVCWPCDEKEVFSGDVE